MKVTVERVQLLKSLGHVHRVVERRNTIPILANVLVRAERSKLSLKATDLDLAWRCAVRRSELGDLDEDRVARLLEADPDPDAGMRRLAVLAAHPTLEAKEEVEAATSDDATTPASLADDLNSLAEATRQAQRTVGDPVLADCSEGS